jgi:hypothetical protein
MARKQPGKSIAFELLLDENSKTRARIPLRVLVNAHDTTESIIATVKNFYGIYDGHGVSFEDAHGNTLIASHENLEANSTVYVRAVPGSSAPSAFPSGGYAVPALPEAQRRPSLGEPFQMLPPHLREQSQSPSRSSSRLARKRSQSPSQLRGRRSASQHKQGSFSGASRGSSASGNYSDDNGYSDSEAGRSSASGSRRAKSDMLASSEISTANVLQDGRRGQTIFDSSVSAHQSRQMRDKTLIYPRLCHSLYHRKCQLRPHSPRSRLSDARSPRKGLLPFSRHRSDCTTYSPRRCSRLRAIILEFPTDLTSKPQTEAVSPCRTIVII